MTLPLPTSIDFMVFNWVGNLLGAKKTPADMVDAAQILIDSDSGDAAQAEKLLLRAMEQAEEVKDYDVIARGAFALGKIYERQEKNAVAETYYRRAYQTWEESEEYEEAAKCLIVLANLYRKSRRLPDAEQLFHYAMSIFQTQFSVHDPRIAIAASCLADCCLDRKGYDEAEKLLQRAIQINEQAKGADDPLLAANFFNLALCYGGLEREGEAEPYFKRATAIFEKNLSEDRAFGIAACTCYHEFGKSYLRRKKNDQARQALNRAQELAEKYPGYLNEADLADDCQKLP